MLRKVSILLVMLMLLVIMTLVTMVVMMMMVTLEQLTGASNNEAIVQLERVRMLYTMQQKYCKCQYCKYCGNPNATKFRKYWKSASAYNGVTPLV